MRKNILNWMKLSSFIFALSSLFASCSNELDEALQPVGNGNLQFVVSDFPTFGEGAATRAIGLVDAGKTAWAEGDKILVHLYSQKYGDQAVELTFKNGDWESNDGTLSYLKGENPTITAVYAPDCEIKEGQIVLQEGKQYGMAEYILANTTISGNTLSIRFESGRTYSRLRIATMSGATLAVTITGFTPAGPNGTTAPESYSLTADDDGNAYLYGSWVGEQTVTATAKHQIYPAEGIKTTGSFYWFDNNEQSKGGMSYVLGVKLGDYMDAFQALSGDVALIDGSIVPNAKITQMTDAQKSAMAGIVFWTKNDLDFPYDDRVYPELLTDDKVMNADFPHCDFHGLIVSLTNTEAMAWQSSTASVSDWQEASEEFNHSTTNYVSIKQSNTDADFNKIYGYQLTKILKAYNEDCNAENVVQPIEALSSFAENNPAPLGSTGWYLPSEKELYILCNKGVDNIATVSGTSNKDALNTIFTQLGEGVDKLSDATYLSSTEQSDNYAFGINFTNGKTQSAVKRNSSYIVRYVCTF